MAEVFEQVVDQQGVSHKGIPGGLNAIMDKLLEIEAKVDAITVKLNSTLDVYTESQHAQQG